MKSPDEFRAALKQAAKARIGEKDGFNGRFSRPILLEDGPAQLIDIGEIAAVEPLFLNDVPDERLLQVEAIRSGGCRLVGDVIGIGDVDR